MGKSDDYKNIDLTLNLYSFMYNQVTNEGIKKLVLT